MTIIEIEDKGGNTLCFFRVKNTRRDDILDMFNNCSIADVDDDYLAETDEPLIRVQQIEDFAE